jgi:hypothetical protein
MWPALVNMEIKRLVSYNAENFLPGRQISDLSRRTVMYGVPAVLEGRRTKNLKVN